VLVPLGPVAVFGASNFPLAFSVAGGDTASALAAGCTVVCKAHPGHPGTSELVARAIGTAALATGMPAGVISLLHGWSNEVGLALVRHSLITAVGFTGSLRGGRALFDDAAARPAPIPVFAEMGSINPVFLLPSALAERGEAIAASLAQSITLGVGQFCTNPGVLLGIQGAALDAVMARIASQLTGVEAGVMLYHRLTDAFAAAVERAREHGARPVTGGREREAGPQTSPGPSDTHGTPLSPPRARPLLLATDADRFVADAALREEVFGPASLVVSAPDSAGLLRAAQALEGQLTASVFGSARDLADHAELLETLERKVGRIIFNGVPTGVEVGHAMHHGGPYPATTDARTTSVGSAAITRFARPVCLQDFPAGALPPELQDQNRLGIWRRINGRLTTDDVAHPD
jgi:NADP-dependent aldehyde dehydrogenase